MDRRTADKAREVIASGDSALIAEMDRTGKVNGVYKKMQTAKTAELIRNEPPPRPSGPFRVIVADPPWQYDKRPDDPSHRGSCPYPMMRVEEIAAMPVKAIAHQDAVLWLWVTNAHLPVVWPIVAAWGFTYKTLLTWVKDKMGLGDWLRGQTEHCLLCVRGRPAWGLKNETTVLHAKNLGHSIKPDAFYAMVEELCPGAKVELFARKNRDGWTSHGGELPVA
jgi:N6-adenosine-specific RNA methylase IME4